MDCDGRFIMQKTVDWSLLNDGMTIPVSACALLKTWDESIFTHGAGKDIKAATKWAKNDARIIFPSGSWLDQQVKEDDSKTVARREIEESKKI